MSSSFVMKYSTLNLVQWNYTWNVLDESFCTDITLDSTEYIYTTGVGIDFYTEEINSFIYKFGYLGEVLWKCIIKGENREMAMCIELDTMDNIYIGGIIPNIDGYNDDVFLMKNPKPTTKDAIAGYNIFLIYILISSIVMTVVVKECFRKKKTHHFRKFISYL